MCACRSQRRDSITACLATVHATCLESDVCYLLQDEDDDYIFDDDVITAAAASRVRDPVNNSQSCPAKNGLVHFVKTHKLNGLILFVVLRLGKNLTFLDAENSSVSSFEILAYHDYAIPRQNVSDRSVH